MNPRATLLRFDSLSPGSLCEPSSADTCEPFGVPTLDSLSVEDAAEYAAWADSLKAASAEVYDAEAHAETRDDGAIYHGRLPSDDRAEQWFNPGHMASASCAPVLSAEHVFPPVVIEDESESLPAWMLRALSTDDKPGESMGDITDALMMRAHDCAGRA